MRSFESSKSLDHQPTPKAPVAAIVIKPYPLPTKGVLGQESNGVGLCLAGIGRRDDALKAHQEAAHLHTTVYNKMPQQTAHRERLSDHYKHIARLQCERGHPADAVAATLERWKLSPAEPEELYSVAVELAMCPESHGQPTTPADQLESAKYARFAIDALRQAIDSGFQDVQDIQVNPAYHSLRSHLNFPKRK